MAGDKYLYNNSGTITEKAAIQTSAGAGDAGKVPALDAAGKLDVTMMPTGIAADVASIATSESLAAGDLVNIYDSSGAKVRKADASVAGKEAHGYVIATHTHPTTAIVYFEGSNAFVTGLTPGKQYLSTTPGLPTATAPSAAGNVVQRVGFATAATSMNFQAQTPYVLA